MSINFTQYLLPNGRKEQVTFDNPNSETQRLADQLIEQGCYFEIEILRTGHVFMDVINADDEEIANQLCNNGPEVENAVVQLIKDATDRLMEDRQ